MKSGVPPPEVEAMLVERGLSRDMAATVVENISGQLPEAAEPYNQPEARGFGNLHLDLWRIVRSNPLLFIVIPTLVWFPFNLFAEYVVLSRGGSFMTQLGVYNRASAIPSILVGAWIAATLFTAIRRLAEGEALDVLRSTLEWSPSKDLALNMFVHNLGRSGSEWSPHREEPDRWLYLFKTPDAKGWPVLVVGPSTLLHSIGWTDDRVSIVLGIARDGSADCLYIWRMLVTDTIVRVERHKGPDVTPAQLEELKHRWPAWIRARYPEVEWAAQ